MIALRTAFPKPALREFVRFYAQRDLGPFEPGMETICEPVPARLEQTLEFQFGIPFKVHLSESHAFETPGQSVVGAYAQGSARIELRPGVISFAVFFQPTGLSRLFGIPLRDITSYNYDAALVSNDLARLRDRLAECAVFERRVQIVERFLLRLAALAPGKSTMLAVADHLLNVQGAIRISKIAADTGLSLRQFERQFLREVGISPKLYARVARFQSALDAKISSPRRSWLEIAHALRYHDQTHMIRDFQLLGGAAPNQLLAQIGDARPGALLPERPGSE